MCLLNGVLHLRRGTRSTWGGLQPGEVVAVALLDQRPGYGPHHVHPGSAQTDAIPMEHVTTQQHVVLGAGDHLNLF